MTLRSMTLVVGLVVAACGSAPDNGEDAAASKAGSSPATPTELETTGPVVDEAFPVSTGGRELAIRCWGDGSPAIVVETGHPGAGIADFGSPALVDPLAEETMICAYDRLGQGLSEFGSRTAPQRR
jgi:hypothetical protein